MSVAATSRPRWCWPETYARWKTLSGMLSVTDLKNLCRPDLVSTFAWYLAYAEQTYRADKEHNERLSAAKLKTLKAHKRLDRELLRLTGPAKPKLQSLIAYLEAPSSGTLRLREHFKERAKEARSLVEFCARIEHANDRVFGRGEYRKPVIDSWENPDHGLANVKHEKRRILLSIPRRTFFWWDTCISRYKGKPADMIVLAERFGIVGRKGLVEYDTLRKLVSDARKAATSNLVAPDPPSN